MQVAVERLKTEAENKHAEEIKAAVLLWQNSATGMLENAKAGEKASILDEFKQLVESINEKMEALVDHANEVGFIARRGEKIDRGLDAEESDRGGHLSGLRPADRLSVRQSHQQSDQSD